MEKDDIKLEARYETGKKATNLKEIAVDGKTNIRVQYRDLASDENARELEEGADERKAAKQLLADLVIGADGPSSIVHPQLLFDEDVDRIYVGYLARHGVVLEDKVSAETRNVFKDNITSSILGPQCGHVVV